MDSEKFDKVVLDLLYDELDELTRASAIRHLEQSGRAKALYSELKATRDVGVLPLVEPPEDLERRILAAEAEARATRPLGQRFGTLISIVASYAMRPQVGMAALLMLMLGSSFLFLRAKPGEVGTPVIIERGVPETEHDMVAAAPAASMAPAFDERRAPEPQQSGPGGDLAARAKGGGRTADAPKSEALNDALARADTKSLASASKKKASALGGPRDLDDGMSMNGFGAGAPAGAAAPAPVALAPAAQAPAKVAAEAAPDLAQEADKKDTARGAPGCSQLAQYEEMRANPTSPAAGHAATWAAAECYREMGSYERARSAYVSLLGVSDYAEQARRALSLLPAPATKPAASKPAATAQP